MRRTLTALIGAAPLALALSLAATPAQAAGPLVLVDTPTGDVVAGQYIVTLKSGTAADFAASTGIAAAQVYSSINGFAAALSGSQLSALQHDPRVSAIEHDQVMRIDAVGSWGLDRIDQRNLPLSGTYTTSHDGAGVTAYVIDTGITPGHPDFGGRAAVAVDEVGDGQNGIDCNGHGTHVAGTIGGATYGVAKGVALRGVRVLNCSGSGTTSGVIAGVDWVRTNGQHPAVANMSLGGGKSTALNNAVAALANSGVSIAVAAGNSSANACNSSPSSTPEAITVAASDINDASASFTNYGKCVDLYAPGVSITSDWLNNGTNTISGTSMATPHVAGVAALYKSAFGDASSATVQSYITSNATAGVITGVPRQTPNRLLYTNGL